MNDSNGHSKQVTFPFGCPDWDYRDLGHEHSVLIPSGLTYTTIEYRQSFWKRLFYYCGLSPSRSYEKGVVKQYFLAAYEPITIVDFKEQRDEISKQIECIAECPRVNECHKTKCSILRKAPDNFEWRISHGDGSLSIFRVCHCDRCAQPLGRYLYISKYDGEKSGDCRSRDCQMSKLRQKCGAS